MMQYIYIFVIKDVKEAYACMHVVGGQYQEELGAIKNVTNNTQDCGGAGNASKLLGKKNH